MTMFKSVLVCLAGVGVALAFLGCGPTKLEKVESEWARDKQYLTKAKDMLEQAQKDLADAKKALVAETDRVQELQGQVNTTKAEKKKLQDEITTLRNANQAAAKKLDDAEQTIKKLKVDLAKQARAESGLKDEVTSLKGTIEDLQKKIRQLEAQLAELKKKPAEPAKPEE